MTHTHTQNIDEYELELLKFPNGKHDDMIDACASAVSILNSQSLLKNSQKIYIPNIA